MPIENLYDKVVDDFPMLQRKLAGKRLVYFDSAATALKPKVVLDAIQKYYLEDTCSVHRSIHQLAEVVTTRYEGTRDIVQKFINAKKREEVIFTKGTTESLNLLARTLGETLSKGDEVLITALEHHSNIVPWQLLAERIGVVLKVVPINENGEVTFDEFKKCINERTKIVSVTGLSNVMGTFTPLKEIIKKSQEYGAKTIVDAAQLVVHDKIDVQELDVDFMAFSAHKLYGPTGVGILYGKEHLLEELPPYLGGGDMIDYVDFEKTTFNSLPYKFEAGTPNISGVIAFSEAIKYIEDLGIDKIKAYDHSLLQKANQMLKSIDGLRVFGDVENKASLISFVIDGIHTHDLASLISMEGIALRTGHHCAQPLHKVIGIPSSARIALNFYNNENDLERLHGAISKAKKLLQ